MKPSFRKSAPVLALLAAGCGGQAGAPAPSPSGSARAAETPAASPRVQPPAPLPMEPAAFPPFQERTLSNGATVIIVENHEQPVASVSLRIRSGSAAEPRDKAGLVEVLAEMLNKGTATRSANEIAQAVDFIGANLGASAADDWTNVGVTALTGTLDTALELLADVVQNPTFPEEELATTRQRMLSALQASMGNPTVLASRRFTSEVYGRHPYGKQATATSLEGIGRSDLVAFHSSRFRPNNALFVVAGDVRPDDIVARLEKHFGGWAQRPVTAPTMFSPPQRTARQVVLVHKPGSVQAVIRAGHLLPRATDSDWYALDLAEQVLGMPFSGWLFKALRADKGYGYSAGAEAAQKPDLGYFLAETDVRNEVVDSALTELFAQLERLRASPVPAADLELSKNFLVGSFPLRIETPQQVAGQVASTRLLGLPSDHLERYRERVAAITAAELHTVVQEHIRPQESVVVVVGDATKIHDKLTPFGPVRIFDAEGKSIALADLEVKAADVTFDASRIEPGDLTYRVMAQGNPIGELNRRVLRVTIDGREAVRATTTGSLGMASVSEDVAIDARTFSSLYSKSTLQAGGGGMKAEFRYEAGRVVGTISVTGQADKQIETPVPSGTLLPGADAFVLAAADLEPGKEIKLPAISEQSGNLTNITFTVKGEKTVTVPAGEFEAYEVEADSPEGRMRLFVRKAVPHILLRQEPFGQPIVVELKEIR